MPPHRSLKVCLCLEDADTVQCDVMINQIASGHVFGSDQPFHLMLHGPDKNHLDDLCLEIQDCAFPLVKGISVHTTFTEADHPPDVFLILLSSRSIRYADSPTEQFQQLFSLVTYITRISEVLSVLPLSTSKILVTGDLALTAAAILSHRLNCNMTARQLLAIDGQLQEKIQQSKIATRHYSKISRMCDTLKQWWSGLKNGLASTYLGLKFLHTGQRSPFSDGSGYFFSAPVDLEGPTTFHTVKDLHLDTDHIREVKATTDTAFKMVLESDGKCSKNDNVNFYLAHL